MKMPVSIRTVQKCDAASWELMRQTLWPALPGEHMKEIARFFNGDRCNPAEVFLAWSPAGKAVGFVELSIRPYAEGCYSGRVAYLEGWFVDASTRGQGVGAALVQAAEEWGRSQGCSELASDTEIDNDSGSAAHRSLGFEEVERIICFRKPL
jgi:aminoglycoside 6'-N-acetyltransferase I